MKPFPDLCIPRLPSRSLLFKECKNLGNLRVKQSQQGGAGGKSHCCPDDSASSGLSLWMQYYRHTQMHDRHLNCTGIMSDEYPPHKTTFPWCKDSQTEILTHYNLLLPWPPPPSSSNSLPFYLSHPFCLPFCLPVFYCLIFFFFSCWCK